VITLITPVIESRRPRETRSIPALQQKRAQGDARLPLMWGK
jgi:hypothetical protein